MVIRHFAPHFPQYLLFIVDFDSDYINHRFVDLHDLVLGLMFRFDIGLFFCGFELVELRVYGAKKSATDQSSAQLLLHFCSSQIQNDLSYLYLQTVVQLFICYLLSWLFDLFSLSLYLMAVLEQQKPYLHYFYISSLPLAQLSNLMKVATGHSSKANSVQLYYGVRKYSFLLDWYLRHSMCWDVIHT